MKSKIKLNDKFLGSLPSELQDGMEDILKECEVDEPILKRNPTSEKFTIEEDDERVAVNYASTRKVDRDKEVIVPDGVILSQFKKAPVLLWGHQWSETPIGSDRQIASDGYGLLAKSAFADTNKGREIWKLVKGRHLRTSSIGFVPMQYVSNGSEKFGPLVDKLSKLWPDFTRQVADNVRGIVPKSLLLEHSLVGVPANIDSLVLAVSSKSLDVTADILKELGVDVEMFEEIDILKNLPDNEGEEDINTKEPEKKEPEKENKKEPRLVARLISVPAPKQVKVYTQAELNEMVKEAMELAKGRI